MKQILQLLNNPVIRSVGVALVLYFALFANKKNPESLGNRLSAEKVKKNFNEVQEKSRFIATNVKIAKTMAKEKIATQKAAQIAASGKAMCGDVAEISYGIYTQEGQQLKFFNSQKFLIGSKENWLIEKNIIGMERGELRNINIPDGFQSEASSPKSNSKNLKYQFTLLALSKGQNPQISCDQI